MNNRKWRFIAEEFDRRFGTSYSQRWNMPDGRTELDLYKEYGYDNDQAMVDRNYELEYDRRLEELMQTLVRLNPELEDMPKTSQANWIVFGVLSRYSKEDIFAFCDGSTGRMGSYNFDTWFELNEKYDLNVAGWVPRPLVVWQVKKMLEGNPQEIRRRAFRKAA